MFNESKVLVGSVPTSDLDNLEVILNIFMVVSTLLCLYTVYPVMAPKIVMELARILIS